MVDLNVHVGSVQLNNPLIAASGTAGFGRELAAMYDLSAWGGISSKGVTRTPRIGNPTPRRGNSLRHAEQCRPAESGH